MELCQLACEDIGLLIQGLKEGKFSNVNRRSPGGGYTVLHICSAIGNLEAVTLLVNAGADLNLQDSRYGRTALHWALVNYQLEVATYLLSKRAELDLLDKEKETPLDSLRKRGLDVFGDPAKTLTELFTWGNGSNYQLGHSSAETVRVPKRVKALSAEPLAMDISAFMAAAVTVDGAVYTWGYGQFRLGHQQPLTLSAERQPSQSKAERDLEKNSTRQHHYQSSLSNSFPAAGELPRDSEVTMLPLRVNALASRQILQVAVSNQHALAVASSGELFSWGSGKDGKLGHENFDDVALPRRVRAGGLEKKSITRVACSDRHSCAITSAGDLFTWGHGAEGQLGHSLTSSFAKPKLVTSILHVVDVSCSETHTIAMSLPPLGSSMLPDAYIVGCGVTSTPQKIHIPSEDIVSFAAARGYTLLLTRSGGLYQARSIGQPAIRVRAIPAKRVIQVSGKDNSFTVLDSNGVLYGWTAECLQAATGEIDRLRVWKELRGRATSISCGGSCSAALTTTPQFDESFIAEPDLQPPYASQLHPLAADFYALLPPEITSICAPPTAAAPVPAVQEDPLAMSAMPASGLGSEHFADVTVVFVMPPQAKARVPPLRLHRVILYSRSTVLRESLQQMKPGSDTLELELGGQYPYSAGFAPLAYFVYFLYTSELPDMGKSTPQEVVSCLVLLSRRFKIGPLASALQQTLERQQKKQIQATTSEEASSDEEDSANEEDDAYTKLMDAKARTKHGRKKENTNASADSPVARGVANDLAAVMGPELNPPPFGDVEIRVAADSVDSPSVSLMCHRAILVARSEFFRSLFLSGMREARKSKVDLQAIRASTFRLILLNLYTGLISPPNLPPLSVAQLSELLTVANQYMMFGLKLQLEDALASHIHIGNVLSLYSLAARHEALKLRALCRDMMARNLHLLTQPHLSEMAAALRADLQEYVRELELPQDTNTAQMLLEVSPAYQQRLASSSRVRTSLENADPTDLARNARKIKKKLAQIDALEAKRTLLGTAELAKVNARGRLVQELSAIEEQLAKLPTGDAGEAVDEADGEEEPEGSDEGQEETNECDVIEAPQLEAEPVPADENDSQSWEQQLSVSQSSSSSLLPSSRAQQMQQQLTGGKRSKTFDRNSSKTVPLTSMHMHQHQPKKAAAPSPAPAPAPAAPPKGWKRPSSEAVNVPRKSFAEIQAEEEATTGRDFLRASSSPQSPSSPLLLRNYAAPPSHSPSKPKGFLKVHRPVDTAVNWKLKKEKDSASPSIAPTATPLSSSASPPYTLAPQKAKTSSPISPVVTPPRSNASKPAPPRGRADISISPPCAASPADFPALPPSSSSVARAKPASASPTASFQATTPPKKTLLEIQTEELILKEARAYRDKRSLLEIQHEEISRKQKQQENLVALQLAQLEALQSSADLDEDLRLALSLASGEDRQASASARKGSADRGGRGRGGGRASKARGGKPKK